MLTLITGGARSGKSRHALTLAASYSHRIFIATAEPLDDEMRSRIDAHQKERGADFHTVEEPIELAEALDALPATTEVVVVDCLTLWLGNLMFQAEQAKANLPTETQSLPPIQKLLQRVGDGLPFHLILVTNELGMGIVPAEPMARAFRDLAGRLNQDLALVADRVILMVSGLPLDIPK